MNWEPIETAPNDGAEILCCDARTGERRVAIRKLFFEKSGRYEWFRDDEHCPGHTWSLEPTHWMPLPSPPNIQRPDEEPCKGDEPSQRASQLPDTTIEDQASEEVEFAKVMP